eukprot:gene10927-3632_t
MKQVSWNPFFSDSFVVSSQNILFHYHFSKEKHKKKQDWNQQISKIQFDSSISTLCWSPQLDVNNHSIISVGLKNGNVFLYDPQENKILKEFIPKLNGRQCFSLHWNQTKTNFIASGVDKSKTGDGIFIWDINATGESFLEQIKPNQNTIYLQKKSHEKINFPIHSYQVYNEATTAISWLPNEVSCLIAGGYKFVRQFDIRDSSDKAISSFQAHSYTIRGIEFDPFDTNRFLTQGEDYLIKVWDIRKLNEPKKQITPSSKSYSYFVKWHNSKKDIIASTDSSDNVVTLWDVSEEKNDFKKPLNFKYSDHEKLYDNEIVDSFSFHPIENYLLLSNNTENIKCIELKKFDVSNISPSNEISFANNFKRELEHKDNSTIDISEIMKIRAQKGFGINTQRNIQISKEMKEFDKFQLWSWIETFKILNKQENRKTYQYIFPGIEMILTSTKVSNDYLLDKSGRSLFSVKMEKEDSFSDSFGKNLFTSDVGEFQGFNKYESYQRKFASKICGWLDCNEKEDEEENTRKFAKYIFSLKLTEAIKVLTNLNNPMYKYLAFALFQYNQNTKDKFRELFQNEKLDDPYLRSSIGFLSSKFNDFSCVLYENEIPFSDRLSFALKYLNHEQLILYVQKMKEKYILTGDLQGIILTGILNNDSISLLSNFNDLNSDIQTICILTTQLPIRDQFSKIILESYRDLLDQWSLFEERAILDIAMAKFKNIEVPKVNVKCKFCNQIISNVVHSKTRSIRKYAQVTNSSKSNSCPNCQKPLPACTICQMSFGTPISSIGESSSFISQNLDNTFVWCVSCKHSGHLKHLMEWVHL